MGILGWQPDKILYWAPSDGVLQATATIIVPDLIRAAELLDNAWELYWLLLEERIRILMHRAIDDDYDPLDVVHYSFKMLDEDTTWIPEKASDLPYFLVEGWIKWKDIYGYSEATDEWEKDLRRWPDWGPEMGDRPKIAKALSEELTLVDWITGVP